MFFTDYSTWETEELIKEHERLEDEARSYEHQCDQGCQDIGMEANEIYEELESRGVEL